MEEKNMVKTVKDLKDFLNMLPDDALVYEQLHTKGKRLEAVDVHAHYRSVTDEHSGEFESGYNVINYYEFPEFVQVPLSTEPTLDFLKRYYKNMEG